MAELSQTEQKYRECRDAIKGGKLIVISDGRRRDFVQSVRKDFGEPIADTLSGPIVLKTATYKIFDNVREAQAALFAQPEKMAA